MSYIVSASLLNEREGYWESMHPDTDLQLVGSSVTNLFEDLLGFEVTREDGVMYLDLDPLTLVGECKNAFAKVSFSDLYTLQRLGQIMLIATIGAGVKGARIHVH